VLFRSPIGHEEQLQLARIGQGQAVVDLLHHAIDLIVSRHQQRNRRPGVWLGWGRAAMPGPLLPDQQVEQQPVAQVAVNNQEQEEPGEQRNDIHRDMLGEA